MAGRPPLKTRSGRHRPGVSPTARPRLDAPPGRDSFAGESTGSSVPSRPGYAAMTCLNQRPRLLRPFQASWRLALAHGPCPPGYLAVARTATAAPTYRRRLDGFGNCRRPEALGRPRDPVGREPGSASRSAPPSTSGRPTEGISSTTERAQDDDLLEHRGVQLLGRPHKLAEGECPTSFVRGTYRHRSGLCRCSGRWRLLNAPGASGLRRGNAVARRRQSRSIGSGGQADRVCPTASYVVSLGMAGPWGDWPISAAGRTAEDLLIFHAGTQPDR